MCEAGFLCKIPLTLTQFLIQLHEEFFLLKEFLFPKDLETLQSWQSSALPGSGCCGVIIQSCVCNPLSQL